MSTGTPSSSLDERIARFENMATADPANDMAHFSLGSNYLQADRAAEAAKSLLRCIELNPDMSKAFQLAGDRELFLAVEHGNLRDRAQIGDQSVRRRTRGTGQLLGRGQLVFADRLHHRTCVRRRPRCAVRAPDSSEDD